MTRSTLIALAIATSLAGCGVRGALETPRADGGAPADATKTATADSGQGKKQGEAQKPHQGFVLDRLLQ